MSLITLTGPSGAGKSTIERALRALGCGVAVSHTTRAPRAGEVNGEHYHFVTEEQFQALDSQHAFIDMVEFAGNRYGMSKQSIALAATTGADIVIVVDPHGATQIRRYCIEHDIAVQSVWVDCRVPTQARRFLDRLLNDMSAGQGSVESYAERLTVMMSEEAKWRSRAEAWIILGSSAYDQKVTSEVVPPDVIARSILERTRQVEAQAS